MNAMCLSNLNDRSPPRLIISHPGSLQLIFGIFAAAQEIGYDTRLWTGYIYDEHGFVERLAARAPEGLRAKLLRELRRRQSDSVPPRSVVRLPWLEFTTVGALRLLRRFGSLPSLLGLRNAIFDRLVAREVRRDRPAVVLPVDSAALETIRAAREIGARSLLNQTIGHVAVGQRILGEEAALHPAWADSMPTKLPAPLIERARREALEADCVLAPSDYVQRTLVEIGVSRDRIRVLPYGVRTDRFAPGPPRPGSEAPFRILYVGQISQRKGLSYLLDAVRRLKRKDVELLLVGSVIGAGAGLRHYDGLFRHIDNRPHSELPDLYRSADLFVYPSLHEGSAQAIMEAMASGLPVIVTPNSGSVARDGIEGYVVPIRNSDFLAERINDLCRDRERLGVFGAAARRRAEEHDWRRYRSGLEEILRDLTGWPSAQ
ncbi:MAG TPA: glycosyltransferase family 4 protein [Alphaproteobacteria bacterium]|nr:glycosyltransferase family 4 protein [Alphaproteobacteria bacterium]